MRNLLLRTGTLIVGLFFALILPACAQRFPDAETLPGSSLSPWSFSLESSAGPSGVFRDSIGSAPASADTTDNITPIVNLFALLLPDDAFFSYSLSAGAHYRLGRGITIGMTAGYETRGAN